MATTMQQYEAEVAPLKRRLFAGAVSPGTDVLELGMGTGPNLRYYGNKVMSGVRFGVCRVWLQDITGMSCHM
jgi:hypothetical protein